MDKTTESNASDALPIPEDRELIAAMPRVRTGQQSRALKNKILKLREENISIIEIAQKLQVSKQYVSLVLIGAGQRGRKAKSKPAPQRLRDNFEKMQAAAAKMEGQGEYTMAELLRTMAERLSAATLPTKESRKQGS